MATSKTYTVTNHDEVKVGEIRTQEYDDAIGATLVVVKDDDKEEENLASISVKRDGSSLVILPIYAKKGFFGRGMFSNLLSAVYEKDPSLFDDVKDVEICAGDEDEFPDCMSQQHTMIAPELGVAPMCIPATPVQARANATTSGCLSELYENIIEDFCYPDDENAETEEEEEDQETEDEEETSSKRVKVCDA
jgi:hypothetical protein